MGIHVFGLEQRGVKGTVAAGGSGNFCPSTGTGYVAYKKPDYAHALSRSDTDLLMLLFETYGGWSESLVRLFRRMKDKVPGFHKKKYPCAFWNAHACHRSP